MPKTGVQEYGRGNRRPLSQCKDMAMRFLLGLTTETQALEVQLGRKAKECCEIQRELCRAKKLIASLARGRNAWLRIVRLSRVFSALDSIMTEHYGPMRTWETRASSIN
jgi:hypothetical protein